MSTTAIAPYRKRSIDSDSPIDNKRPKSTYFIRLASESPAGSTEDDTESVYSVQGRETDFVKDTSDTDSTEFEVEIEYDIASLSASDREGGFFGSTSGSDVEQDLQDVVVAAAAAVCDTSLENFITDGEDSDNSGQDDSSSGLRDFWTCIQCKSQNDNPQYRFCEKCFQDRKMFFPPRPRRHRKNLRSKEKEKCHSPVKLETLQSCLSGLSQDSGIGSSQELPSLHLDQIVVSIPEASTSERKRQISESSLSEDYEVPKPKKQKKEASRVATPTEERSRTEEEKSDLCMVCNSKPKNSVFLHGRIAHMCCCYHCAMRTWKTLKRCPICNRKVGNVVRVFTT